MSVRCDKRHGGMHTCLWRRVAATAAAPDSRRGWPPARPDPRSRRAAWLAAPPRAVLPQRCHCCHWSRLPAACNSMWSACAVTQCQLAGPSTRQICAVHGALHMTSIAVLSPAIPRAAQVAAYARARAAPSTEGRDLTWLAAGLAAEALSARASGSGGPGGRSRAARDLLSRSRRAGRPSSSAWSEPQLWAYAPACAAAAAACAAGALRGRVAALMPRPRLASSRPSLRLGDRLPDAALRAAPCGCALFSCLSFSGHAAGLCGWAERALGCIERPAAPDSELEDSPLPAGLSLSAAPSAA